MDVDERDRGGDSRDSAGGADARPAGDGSAARADRRRLRPRREVPGRTTRRRWCCGQACGRRGCRTDSFWYRITTENGSEAFLVDPVKGNEGRLRRSLRAPRTPAGRGGRGRGGAPAGRRTRRRGAERRAVARRQAERVHPRLEPVGARYARAARRQRSHTDGVKDFGYATDNAGWARSDRPIRRLVARLEADRDLPAGSAERRRDVSRQHDGRPSRTAGMEVSAARRRRWSPMIQRVVIDVATGEASCASRWTPTSIGPRSATTCPAAAATGKTCSGRPDSKSIAFVSTLARSQEDDAARRGRRDRQRARRPRGERSRPSSSRATGASTGATCRHRTRSSGFPSATTGASCISTICRPAS